MFEITSVPLAIHMLAVYHELNRKLCQKATSVGLSQITLLANTIFLLSLQAAHSGYQFVKNHTCRLRVETDSLNKHRAVNDVVYIDMRGNGVLFVMNPARHLCALKVTILNKIR